MFNFFKNLFGKKAPIETENVKKIPIETVRCPFCHEQIEQSILETHIKEIHLVKLPDGQQKDHLTTPPQMRYEGSLENVPQAYYHKKCGCGTGMPEEIIRSYLIDPFLHNDYTFCCGCNDYVHISQVYWLTPEHFLTDETVHQYIRKLRMAHNKKNGTSHNLNRD
jgi:hypothetical protein